jgi:hypothetical protein
MFFGRSWDETPLYFDSSEDAAGFILAMSERIDDDQ